MRAKSREAKLTEAKLTAAKLTAARLGEKHDFKRSCFEEVWFKAFPAIFSAVTPGL
jgi:hypothetical protein